MAYVFGFCSASAGGNAALPKPSIIDQTEVCQKKGKKKRNMLAFPISRRNCKLADATRRHFKSSQRAQQLKKTRLKNLNTRMKRLRVEMEEISEEQKKIKDGQRQVREKFEAIELECEQLQKETKLITQQSLSTQIRLALMFQILKARENHDFSKASQLTCVLRELIERENQQKEAFTAN